MTGGAVKTAKVNVKSENTCTDSEKGVNGFAPGTVSGVSGESYFEKKDRCVGSYFLFEFYCDGNVMAHQNFRCLNGCEKGACKS